MALFKSKNSRRSSSTSYASTLTTLIFVALCVLGIWMLSSNSVISPLNRSGESITTHSAIDNTATNNDLSSSEELVDTTTKSIEEPVETIDKSSDESTETTTKIQDQKEIPAYGDNPGHLPDDAIKSDDKNPNVNTNNDPHIEQNSQISEESSLTQKQEASETNGAISDTDQKASSTAHKSQNLQSTTSTKTSAANHQEDNSIVQETKQNSEPENVNASENQQLQEDIQSFDSQEPKKDENEQSKPFKEDKDEIIPKDQKQQSQELRVEQQDEQHKNSDSLDASQQESNESLKSQISQLSQAEKTQKIQDETQETQTGVEKDAIMPKSSKSLSKESNQADQLQNEKEGQKDVSDATKNVQGYTWQLCNVTAGADYIPCLDNEEVIRKLRSRKHFEHRERHCPEDVPTCLVPLPKGYKRPIEWPNSRDKIWYHNVPHVLLAEVKGHQNWVKVSGEFLTFPGGGTQFIHGALHYIDFLQQAEPKIAWGKHTRVILDVGCGVGSFGGYLFERDVITMSFAPKDEHEAQVQFALERGIPAISAVMGSQRLPFPGRVFDLVHCARCRVPWHADGGLLLLELNRVLRPGGYFVWSATPVYQTLEEDVQIWKEMTSLTKAMCWDLVTIKKDKLNQVGAAVYRKPTSNECYQQRKKNVPPMCKNEDDPNAAWYVPLEACMHKVPVDKAERGARWPDAWPRRLHTAPYWLNNSHMDIDGKPDPQDFVDDTERWKNVVDEMSNIGITWSNIRNVMDMRAVLGGFAAALRDLPVWVLNVVNVDSTDTLPIIYERGLFGMYHDWCESFSTYPRTYDLLHADNLFSKLKDRCKLVPVMAEVDRIVRPEGKLIVRDDSSTIGEVESLLKSLHWEIISSKKQEGILCAKKSNWRPTSYVASS